MRFALSALALITAAASAQAPTEGFVVSPRLYGASVSVSEAGDEADTGGGLGLRVGYGFSKTITAFVAFEGASVGAEGGPFATVAEDYALGSLDVGAQFNLLPSNSINPFLRASLNGTGAVFDLEGVDSDDDPRLSGGGLSLGAGAEFRLSRSLAVEAALDLSGGQISTLEAFGVQFNDVDGSDYRTGRLGVGLVWRP